MATQLYDSPRIGLLAQAEAHSGDRLFPIPELTDEMLEKIQLDDGSVEEWYDLAVEPTMSLVDFRRFGILPDPSDLDFRIWLAWGDEPDRLYVAFAAIDDSIQAPKGGTYRPPSTVPEMTFPRARS